jgi:hypothetical protein
MECDARLDWRRESQGISVQPAMKMRTSALLMACLLGAWAGRAQTNGVGGSAPAGVAANRAEEVRTACIQGRRLVCGKVLKVLEGGLVIESGYAACYVRRSTSPGLSRPRCQPAAIPISLKARSRARFASAWCSLLICRGHGARQQRSRLMIMSFCKPIPPENTITIRSGTFIGRSAVSPAASKQRSS